MTVFEFNLRFRKTDQMPANSSMDSASKKKKKPSSVRSTPNHDNRSLDGGSRASSGKSLSASQSASNSMTDMVVANSNSTELSRGYDLRAHLAQIMMFSEEEDDVDDSSDDYSLESFDGEDREVEEELKRLVGNGDMDYQPPTPKPTGSNNCQSLVPITEENDDLDSEEENEIMKEIRDEIRNNVRQEMKSELELYQAKMKKLEKQEKVADGEPVETESQSSDQGVNADLDNIDPKLKEAIIKMKKLDKILAKRVRREKEVKRDRILLERRIRREIEELHEEGKEEYKEVRTNEQKFLALELPARHNEDTEFIAQEASDALLLSDRPNDKSETQDTSTVTEPRGSDYNRLDLVTSDELTPRTVNRLVTEAWGSNSSSSIGVKVPDEFTGEEVFATQLNEDEYPGLQPRDGQRLSDRSRKSKSRSTRTTSRQDSEDTESRGDSNSVASGSVNGKGKHCKKGKDFIKRNRELAADAGNMIAMTDEEKKRLDELLNDVDKIPDIPEGMELDDSNPFQIAIKPGEGFQPDTDELRSLTSIDSRLKEIMPPEDYESIASSALSYAPKHKLFTHTGIKNNLDWESRGERVLFQNAEQREMNERMFAIDQELARIKNPEDHELDTPRLGEDQLQDLIEQCVTSLSMTNMSRLTLNSESRTSMADTESIMSHDVESVVDNTPRTLSPTSARRELLEHPPKLAPDVLQKLLAEAYHPLSKELSALQEVENEDDEETTPVPAEVWKLIAMEGDPDAQNGPESQPDNSDTVNNDNSNKVGEHGDSIVTINNSKNMGNNNNVNHTDVNTVNQSNSRNSGNNNDSISHQSANAVIQSNSKNGFRTLSRNSSASSLTSVSDVGRESFDCKPLKLPEIDPSGTLVTQGVNMNNQRFIHNQQRIGSSASSRSSTRNSLLDSRSEDGFNGQVDSSLDIVSLDGDVVLTPRPPSERRDGSANSNKSRTITHTGKTNIT